MESLCVPQEQIKIWMMTWRKTTENTKADDQIEDDSEVSSVQDHVKDEIRDIRNECNSYSLYNAILYVYFSTV